MYQYRAAKDRLFPGIEDNWDNIPWSERNKYTAWQKQVAGQYPDAAPYILSDNAIRKSLGLPSIPYNPISKDKMSPELQGQMIDFETRKVPLSAGAHAEMRRLWNEAGKPEETYDKFISSIMK